MQQRLSVVTLGISDLKRARSFYEAIGWRSAAAPADDVVFFQIGGSVLSCSRARVGGKAAARSSVAHASSR